MAEYLICYLDQTLEIRLLTSLVHFRADKDVFKNCNAYTIADEKEWQGRLSGIMQQIGFRYNIKLEAAGTLSSSTAGMLNFLIMHSSKSRDLVYTITKAIRSSNDDVIRFMPIIVLLDASLESEVHQFINLGCDDIIIYPCPPQKMAQRLELQVNTQREYFETDNYFGPDRRITTYDKPHPLRQGGKQSTYKHILIKRQLTGRINIISETMHTPAEQQEEQKKTG